MKKALPRIEQGLRFLLAAIFLWAGLSKLSDPQDFADGIASFHFFPVVSIHILALTVPMLELGAALLNLSGRWTRQGALLCVLLTIVFAALFSWALLRGLDPQCSCFGHGDIFPDSPVFGLARAILLYLASMALYLARTFRISMP